MRVTILFNEPLLPREHPDYTSEAGVLVTVDACETALVNAGYEVQRLGLRTSIAELVARLSGANRPDVVLNLCEGFAGRSAGEAHIAGVLDALDIPYTGSPPECLGLVLDKPRTKRLLQGAGLPTAPFMEVVDDAGATLDALRPALAWLPLFVKPAREDASLGVTNDSVVTTPAALLARVTALRAQYGPVLVEKYIDGRELNVGVIALPTPQVLPLSEIGFATSPEFPHRIVSYASKWSPGSVADLATVVQCPAEVDPALADQLRAISLAAFRLTGCRDYARFDFRVDAKGHPYVLEVNGNPDITPEVAVGYMLTAAQLPHAEFITRLVENAARRKRPGSPVSVPATQSTSTATLQYRGLLPGDMPRMLQIVSDSGMFRPDEIAIAQELIEDTSGDYKYVLAEHAGRVVGWAIYGVVPLTDATFDLYWIAVDPTDQKQGFGRQLLHEVERLIRNLGGRWVLAETSGLESYASTRAFYARNGFHIVGDVPDFYRVGDSRITYGKRV